MAGGAGEVSNSGGRGAGSNLSGLGPGLAAAVALLGLAVAVFTAIVMAAGDAGSGAGVAAVLGFTIFQASVSTALALGLGLLVAWALCHQPRFFARPVLVALLAAGMVLPTVVAALGLISVFGRKGWFNQLADLGGWGGIGAVVYGLGGILLAHTYLNAPFVARSLLQRLEALPLERRKLGQSLGLSPWQRFRFVEWPALKSSLPGLGAVVFLLCFTSFSVVLMLGGGPRFNTLEVAIYEAVKLEFDLGRAVQLALVQVAVCAVLVLAVSGLRITDASISSARPFRRWPDPRLAGAGQVLIIGLFALFFLTPLMAVAADGLRADLGAVLGDAVFRRALWTSLAVAALSTVVTLALSLSIGIAKGTLASPLRMPPSAVNGPLSRILSFSGAIYLAVPSLVLGLGFFLIVRQMIGDAIALAPAAVVTANVLLALPFALVVLVPALEKSALRYDRLALALGFGGLSRWRHVEWPLVRRELGLVSALSFCFSFGDLGVIALFGNRDFTTLPWLLYQKMGVYRTTEAAGIALFLLVLILAVFLVVPKLFAPRHAEA